MRLFAFLPLLVTPAFSLHLCEPFYQAKYDDMTLSFVEAEKTPTGVNFTFFAEKEGVDSANEWGMANMGPFHEDVQALSIKAHAYNGNKLVDCRISTPGWEDWRFYAKADCPLNAENPEKLTLILEHDAIVLDVCTDPPKPSRSTPSLAVCVRSFSSTVFGTDEIAVTPGHVIRWLDHHIKLGIDRFYLYERNKGELSSFLEPYMSSNPSVRETVDITYVPRLSQQTRTFDKLETKSYVFDQILTMQSCFSKARTQDFDFVIHIDYDEYIHPPRQLSIHEAVQNDMSSCTTPNGLTMVRCNIPNVKYDVPEVPMDAECSPSGANVKTAFNATFMGGDIFHTIHVVEPRCDSDSVLIHHLPDAYVDRSSSPQYFRNLRELQDTYESSAPTDIPMFPPTPSTTAPTDVPQTPPPTVAPQTPAPTLPSTPIPTPQTPPPTTAPPDMSSNSPTEIPQLPPQDTLAPTSVPVLPPTKMEPPRAKGRSKGRKRGKGGRGKGRKKSKGGRGKGRTRGKGGRKRSKGRGKGGLRFRGKGGKGGKAPHKKGGVPWFDFFGHQEDEDHSYVDEEHEDLTKEYNMPPPLLDEEKEESEEEYQGKMMSLGH